MDRLHSLAARPWHSLGLLGAILAAVGVAIGSGASFTAQTANPSNTFSSGTLSMVNSKENTAVLTASGMAPGDSASGTVDIENSGSVEGTFSLSRSDLVDSDAINPMSAKIDLVVRDCGDFGSGAPACEAGDPVKYSGTLAAMSTSSALGDFAAGEKHRYEFVATFNSSAGNVYQGDSTSSTFQWDAVQ